ncbi:MAG: dihydroorotase [Acholeplasmatales bacterium]|nr:dihydroorotase [Acholeplasmatales bacterium]
MILLKNGNIVLDNKMVKKDILIDNGKIKNIDDNIECDCEIFDVDGMLITPGLVDVHVHFREPGYEYKETIKSGTMASAKGGITSCMPMPNLKPVPDCRENLLKELDIIKRDSLINCYPYGSITIGEQGKEASLVDEFHDLVYAISDDGMGNNNIGVLETQMEKALKYDIVIASHSEDLKYIKNKEPEGEIVAVEREIEMAKKIGCRYHFCHLSTRKSIELVRKAKAEGYRNITCEIAPHHLVLNKNLVNLNPNFKMNPPLRIEDDRLACIEALVDGTCDIIATDHAPHSEAEKALEFLKAPNGIIGVETMFPLIYTEFVKTGIISLDRMLDLMVYNPIKVFNLPKRGLNIGDIADIAVFDINNSHIYSYGEIESLSKNSPFIGRKLYGFTKLTIKDGKVIYNNLGGKYEG